MLYPSVKKFVPVVAACATLACLSSPLEAAVTEIWPIRPIRLVVPFAAGGSNDVLARQLALRMGPAVGQQIIVDNRGGAGGILGANLVATATPDGYTLLFNSYSLATGVAAQKTPYDPGRDFAAVGRVAVAPLVIVVRNNFPARSVQEFVAYAKSNPGKISFASSGPGSSQHLVTELFGLVAGIKMEPIHYKGASSSMIDMIAGRIDLTITTDASLSGVGGADKLPKLAYATPHRVASAPDVPTAREAGIDFVVEDWFALFAPRGLPKKIQTRLNSEIHKVAADSGFIKSLSAIGATPSPSSPEEMQDILVKDVRRWTITAEKAGIQPR